MPTFLKQINGNRFQSSLDLLSIPVYLDWHSSIIYLTITIGNFIYTLHTPIHTPNYQSLPVKGVKIGDYSSTGSPKRVAEDALWILTRMN